MERRKFILQSASIMPGWFMHQLTKHDWMERFNLNTAPGNSAAAFGPGFKWGVATSALQAEGAYLTDGKGLSIWDTFSEFSKNIKDGASPKHSVDFYHRYTDDLRLLQSMNFNSFRFAISWPRIFPEGTGRLNSKGLDFYQRVTDTCLEMKLEPWITLYHWDLPQTLEDKGGWTNRDILCWFSDYVDQCTRLLGDRVKNWMVLNEPLSFTGLGYFLGIHAPGRKGLRNFIPAIHHAALCQAEGGRIVRANIPGSYVGTTFSCAHINPVDTKEINVNAAARMDALFNRLFLEPSLGMGYPLETLEILKKLEKYIQSGDEEKLRFDFDFIGLQYYFRMVWKFSLLTPFVFASEIPAKERNARTNSMGFEIFPEGIYDLLHKFNRYKGIREIVITESGVCLDDLLIDGRIQDTERIHYYRQTLASILKAKQEGIPVKGYFAWTLTDNFEWNEGYSPRFGLVYINYDTLERFLKDSGLWFRQFLNNGNCYLPVI
jgi:beta-glucosidase